MAGAAWAAASKLHEASPPETCADIRPIAEQKREVDRPHTPRRPVVSCPLPRCLRDAEPTAVRRDCTGTAADATERPVPRGDRAHGGYAAGSAPTR